MKTSELSSFPTLRTGSCLTRKEFYSNFPCCLRSEPSSSEIVHAPGLIIPSMPGISKVLYIRGVGAWSGRRDQGGGWLYVGGEFFAVLGEGPKVAFDLESVPKVLGLAEEDAEADGHGGSDGAPA